MIIGLHFFYLLIPKKINSYVKCLGIVVNVSISNPNKEVILGLDILDLKNLQRDNYHSKTNFQMKFLSIQLPL